MNNKPWLSQYPEQIRPMLQYEKKPVQSFLTEAAETYPRKIAIDFLGKEITYQELYDSALKFANYLKGLGVQKGDRVAIMLPNSPQSVISYYGVLYAGGIVVQTNPLYTERELAYQMKDSNAKVIVTLDVIYPRVEKVIKQTSIEHIIVTAIRDYLPFVKSLIYPFVQRKQYDIVADVEHGGNNHLFKRVLAEAEPEKLAVDFDFEKDIALLQYTGGTTGFPKGVMLTHKNLIANATMCDAWLYKCGKGEESVLGVLPFFHVYGMTTILILSIMQGYKMILLPKFDPETTLKTIHKKKPTFFPGAPTIYIGLLNHPHLKDYDLSSIKACLSGASPLPYEVKRDFEQVTGGKLVEGYGLTETSPITHANFIWDQSMVKGSVGVPWPDTVSEIRSLKTGQPLPPGEIGEIVVKGPQVMKGYWQREEETAEVLKDGWLHTGDLGYMDENGYFYVVDRKKDMIIAGGYNIYPREIEEVLYEHEAIQEAVVVGVPDPYRGETVKAYIVLKENETVSKEALDKYARKYLAAYKVPKIYEFRDDLPKSAVGKILRRTLAEEERKKFKDGKKSG